MTKTKQPVFFRFAIFIFALAAVTLLLSGSQDTALTAGVSNLTSYIVQGDSVDAAAAAVATVGGEVSHELAIITAVGATLTEAQAARLEANGLRLYADRALEVAGKPGGTGGGSGTTIPETYYPRLIGAENLNDGGIIGSGVAIAFIDTGIFEDTFIKKDAFGAMRVNAYYNAISDLMINSNPV